MKRSEVGENDVLCFAAGSFPHRVREQSRDLHQRMQETQKQELERWNIDRENAVRDTRIVGQIEIQEEFDALDGHRRGHVTLFLYGLQHQQITPRQTNVARENLGDFIDLLVHVRREWMDSIQVYLMDMVYINPQVPPVAQGGIDGLSIICDFAPTEHGIPVAVLSSTTFPGEETTYDLSVHRAPELINKDAVLRLTGFMLLCEANTACTCTHVGKEIREIPIRTFPGMRIDVAIVFQSEWCQTEEPEERNETSERRNEDIGTTHEDDTNSLMARFPTRATVRRFFVYLEGAEEPVAFQHFDELDLPGETIEERVVFQFRNLDGITRAGTYTAHLLDPQPEDLRIFLAQGYVIALEENRPAAQRLVLADITILNRRRNRRFEDSWRIAQYVPATPTREKILEAFEVLHQCGPHQDHCTIFHAHTLWAEGRTVKDGDYIQIKITPRQEEDGDQECNEEGGDGRPMETQHEEEQASSNATTSSTLEEEDEEEEDHEMEENSEMQIRERLTKAQERPSSSDHALRRLPPPGNGMRKRDGTKAIRFSDEVEYLHVDGRKTRSRDRLLSDDHVLLAWEQRGQEEDNQYVKGFLDGLRYDDNEIHEPKEGLPLERLCEEEAPIEDVPHQDEHQFYLPIDETYQGRETNIFEESDTQGIYDLLGWIERIKIMPHYDVSQVRWKETSKLWSSLEPWYLQEADEMWFYVDGTQKGVELAAGTIMFARKGNRWYMGGFIGEYISNEKGDLGIYEAELHAQTIACKWIIDEVNLQIFNFGRVPKLEIIYDSCAAGEATTGGFGGNINNHYFTTARSLMHMITLGHGWEVKMRHQRSHIGEPGNEAADDVASWALTQAHKVTGLSRFREKREQKNFQWLWWVVRQRNPETKTLGCPFDWEKPQARMDPRIIDKMKGKENEKIVKAIVDMEMNVVSYNINSVNDQEKSSKNGRRFSPTKFEALTCMYDAKRVHLFMLQETRLRRRITSTSNYMIFQGIADSKGRGGVMIGISRKRGIFRGPNRGGQCQGDLRGRGADNLTHSGPFTTSHRGCRTCAS